MSICAHHIYIAYPPNADSIGPLRNKRAIEPFNSHPQPPDAARKPIKLWNWYFSRQPDHSSKCARQMTTSRSTPYYHIWLKILPTTALQTLNPNQQPPLARALPAKSSERSFLLWSDRLGVRPLSPDVVLQRWLLESGG